MSFGVPPFFHITFFMFLNVVLCFCRLLASVVTNVLVLAIDVAVSVAEIALRARNLAARLTRFVFSVLLYAISS